MKKIIISFSCIFVLGMASFANLPNEKVLEAFHATFSTPKEVRWHDYSGYYDVSFFESGVQTSARYDKKGNFISCIRYYKDQHLPTNLMVKLRKRYADKTIFGVTEITVSETTYYYIKLENDKNWITVKANSDDLLEVVEKYKKA
jgi:hypothetical protein